MLSSEFRKNKKEQTFVLDMRRKVYVPVKRTDSSKWVLLALIAVALGDLLGANVVAPVGAVAQADADPWARLDGFRLGQGEGL